MRSLLAGLFAAIFLLFVAPAKADTTYTYVGQDFTYGCTTCSIDFSFTVVAPIAPNAIIGNYYSSSGFVPSTYAITDGLTVLDETDSFLDFGLRTDTLGNVSGWVFDAFAYPCSACVMMDSGGGTIATAQDSSTLYNSAYTGADFVSESYSSKPGTWTVTDTPEPSSLSLCSMALGFLGVAWLFRRPAGLGTR